VARATRFRIVSFRGRDQASSATASSPCSWKTLNVRKPYMATITKHANGRTKEALTAGIPKSFPLSPPKSISLPCIRGM